MIINHSNLAILNQSFSAAFAGGLLATWLILLLARLVRGGLAGLLLMGLVVGAFCGAIMSLVMLDRKSVV